MLSKLDLLADLCGHENATNRIIFLYFKVKPLDDCYFGSMMKRVPHVLEQNYNFMMGYTGVHWKISEGPDFETYVKAYLNWLAKK